MSFTYRGTTSDSMHFNVTERQVYNAPAFDVNAIEVPGRSGDVLNSQNRFKNKTIVYTGFLREQDFPGDSKRARLSRGLRNLKAWICGDPGKYHDLTDDYDPGFIRRAFVSGETAINEILDQPDGVTITVTFYAEPFMYEATEPIELPETGTASGAIASFEGVVAPLKSLVFSIEPQQNLNGYSYPWPGGGGKNKFDGNAVTTTHASNWGITFSNEVLSVEHKNSYTSGFPRTTLNVPVGTYVASYAAVSETGQISLYVDGAYNKGLPNNTTFQVESGHTYEIVFGSPANTTTTFTKFQIESGSFPTAYAPYSNICPISGWTQVDAWKGGVNMLTKVLPNALSLVNNYAKVISGAGTTAVFYAKAGQTYRVSGATGRNRSLIAYYDADPVVDSFSNSVYQSPTQDTADGYIFTAQQSAYCACYLANSVLSDVNIQVETGSTASTYAAPTITPITISLGQTVYGGYVDALAGVLTITHKLVTFSGTTQLSMTWNASYGGVRFTDSEMAATGFPINDFKSNILLGATRRGTSAELTFCIKSYSSFSDTTMAFLCGSWTSVNEFNTFCSSTPIQVMYPLASPQTVQLTGQQVSSLLGQNNVWCNTGETTVVYVVPTENPTEWPSKPLLEITMSGAGTLTINGKTWTIGAYTGTLYCDPDIMDWYDAGALKNSLVSGDGFPEFQPGENIITYTGGITKVVATPRWRTL